MSRSLNRAQLIGNLTRDPECRYTGSGIAVASFSIATNETYKDAEGTTQEKVQFHNIVAWRKLAEICGEYLKKGSKIYLEGRIQYRTYDDKNGVKRFVTEIVMSELVMLDSRKSEEVASPATPSAKDDDRELPF